MSEVQTEGELALEGGRRIAIRTMLFLETTVARCCTMVTSDYG